MMYRILIIFALLLQTLIFAPQVRADCTVEPDGQACADYSNPATCETTYKYTCEGTTQYDTCPPNYHLTGNGCEENGTEEEEECFPAGTQISMADGSKKNIEEVQVGERVMSQSEGGVRGSSTVTNLIQPVSDNMCEIKLVGADDLKVTNSHPLATVDGWKAIDTEAAARERESVAVTKLEVGDRMVGVDGSNPRVESIKCWDERVQTYNFTVDNDHTYFAGGYLAHNKGAVPTDCRAPKDCPANNSCVPTTTNNCAYDLCTPPGSYACYPFNIDTNHYVDHYVVSKAQYERNCRIGNAQSLVQTFAYDTWTWYLREYNCCPAGTVSTYTYIQPADTYHTVSQCDHESTTNCWPGTFVSWTPQYWCGRSPKDEEGNREDWYVGTKRCRPARSRVYSCVSICNSTAPTNLSVAQGASGTAATLSWRSGTGGTAQVIYVGSNQNSVNNDCAYGGCVISGAVLSPFYANSNFSYPVTGLSPNTTYYFRVVTQENSSCRPSATVSYTVPNLTLSGRVYLDSNNNCSTSTPWSLGGLTVSVRGTAYSGSVGSDGRFGFYGGTGNPISYLDLAGYSSSYVPSTATGCNLGATLTSVANPSSTNYYYLTPRREAWWQAVGGSIYSSGNVRSELPGAGEYLIAPGAGGALGALMRATGSVDTGAGAVSTEGYSAVTTYRGKRMNYDYFAAHIGVTRNQENDWVTDSLSKPANDPDTVFYYHEPSGSEASVNSPWNVAAGESYIVFVDGDLRIASDITVEEGGFLAFIVDGSMRVSPAVTTISGLYVIDGSLITESNGTADVAANFEGSIIAWSGVNMGRDLVANNLGTPAESFAYRPDLLVNMPEAMKVFALRWQEVVPGSYGE